MTDVWTIPASQFARAQRGGVNYCLGKLAKPVKGKQWAIFKYTLRVGNCQKRAWTFETHEQAQLYGRDQLGVILRIDRSIVN